MLPTSGVSEGAQGGGMTPEVGWGLGDDIASACGRRAVWNVDSGGDGHRPVARLSRAVDDAKSVAHAAHSGPAALERANPKDAPRLSGDLARAHVVECICRVATAETQQDGQNPGCHKSRQELRRKH